MAEDEIIVELHTIDEISVHLCSGKVWVVNHGRFICAHVVLEILWDSPHGYLGVYARRQKEATFGMPCDCQYLSFVALAIANGGQGLCPVSWVQTPYPDAVVIAAGCYYGGIHWRHSEVVDVLHIVSY
jgi:hypothetical protein